MLFTNEEAKKMPQYDNAVHTMYHDAFMDGVNGRPECKMGRAYIWYEDGYRDGTNARNSYIINVVFRYKGGDIYV